MKKQQIIYFASTNKNKLKEIKKIWPLKSVDIKLPPKTLKVTEDGKSFIENAYKKARTISKKVKEIAFSDDSGIEIFALNRKPGIYSSRYFRNGKGINEIIKKLKNKKNRRCCFTCAIVATNPKGKAIFKVKKTWHGTIANEARGKNGFGYDPIFLIPRVNKTSAEISPRLKNKLSHRAMAIKVFAKWLKGFLS